MEAILSFIQNFLKKTWTVLGFAKNIFWVFLSVPHLVDNYAKIVDGRGGTLCAIAHYRAALFSVKTLFVSLRIAFINCTLSSLALSFGQLKYNILIQKISGTTFYENEED